MMKPTKKDKRTYRELGPRRPNLTLVGMKVTAKERFREDIKGWQIVRKTKKTKNDQTIYCTYYQSSNHIQDFLNRIRLKKKEVKYKILEICQFEPGTYDEFEDPATYKYGVLLLTNEPFEEEFEDWEIVRGPKECTGMKNLWTTLYRSDEKPWEDLMDQIKSDKGMNRVVERMIPDLYTRQSLYQTAKNRNYFEESEQNRKKHTTVTKKGGFRATKYDYPKGCVSKQDRSKYRRMMRKERKNNGQ
jgi:hypothetical protein